MSNTPQIYVADLAAYNNGSSRGLWIDATQDAEAIQTEIDAMLAKSRFEPAEDWAIHDYDGFFDLRMGEHEDLEQVSRVANLIAKHGAVFAAVVNHLGGVSQLDEAEEMMTEKYAGDFDSVEQWAEQLADDQGGTGCNEPYASHIDWEGIARDHDYGGDIWSFVDDKGRTHVFWAT